jgi:transposase
MVRETTAESGERFGVVTRVARQLGVGTEPLRLWVNQAEIDAGQRPSLSTEEGRRIVQLERENRELRRANEILTSSTGGSELPDGPASFHRASNGDLTTFIDSKRRRAVTHRVNS